MEKFLPGFLVAKNVIEQAEQISLASLFGRQELYALNLVESFKACFVRSLLSWLLGGLFLLLNLAEQDDEQNFSCLKAFEPQIGWGNLHWYSIWLSYQYLSREADCPVRIRMGAPMGRNAQGYQTHILKQSLCCQLVHWTFPRGPIGRDTRLLIWMLEVRILSWEPEWADRWGLSENF